MKWVPLEHLQLHVDFAKLTDGKWLLKCLHKFAQVQVFSGEVEPVEHNGCHNPLHGLLRDTQDALLVLGLLLVLLKKTLPLSLTLPALQLLAFLSVELINMPIE